MIEIIIDQQFHSMNVAVYAKDDQKGVLIGYDGNKLIEQPFPNGPEMDSEIKPLLNIPMHMFELLLKSFVLYGDKAGIQTENENHLKGKLTATEFHLEDLRKLLKLVR